jgi:hypothetical protein
MCVGHASGPSKTTTTESIAMKVTRSARRLFFVYGIVLVAFPAGMACVEGEPASPFHTASVWNTVPAGPVDGQSEAETDAGSGTDRDADLDINADIPTDVVEAGCPRDLPDACPSLAPSWMNDVQGIINHRCSPCHVPGGVEFPRVDLSTYAKVHQSFGAILSNVYACVMPPPDAEAPTPAERQALLEWLVCMAPDN